MDRKSLLIPTLVPGPDPEFDPEFALPRDEHPDWAVDQFVKHYGPGPHPGTGTEQSAHAGGQLSLSPEMFGPDPPTPKTKITYSVANVHGFFDLGPAGQEERIQEAQSLFGRPPSALLVGEFYDEDKLAIRHAVAAFEEEFGTEALPDEIEFRLDRSHDGSMAWVQPFEADHVIYINDVVWNDDFEMDTWIGHLLEQPYDNAQGDALVEIASKGFEADPYATNFTSKMATVFHELVHASSKYMGWNDWQPHTLPHYNPPWFANQVTADDPSLPSAYASVSRAEFLAEALTDVWLNRDEAAPISKQTYDEFKRLVAEGPRS